MAEGVQEPRSFDAPSMFLGRLASSWPRAAYAMADALGAARNRITRRWPTAAEVRELFPHLDERGAARLAARIGALHERNRVLVHSMIRRGVEPLRQLVTPSESFRSLRGPCILGTFHTGAFHAFAPALEQLQSPSLSFREGLIVESRGDVVIESTDGNEQTRAAALHRALQNLRAGGVVLLALDIAPGQALETRCLGHPLRIAPGAFALARWTGAPIRTAVARWAGSRIVVDAGDPLTTADDAGRWLERYLLGAPSEMTLGLLRNLLGVS